MIGLSFPLCPRLFWHRSQSGHCLTRYPPCRNPPPPGDWERNSFGAACRGENEVLYVFFWLIFSQINPGNGRKWAFLSSFWEKISTGRPGGPPPPQGRGRGVQLVTSRLSRWSPRVLKQWAAPSVVKDCLKKMKCQVAGTIFFFCLALSRLFRRCQGKGVAPFRSTFSPSQPILWPSHLGQKAMVAPYPTPQSLAKR